MFVWKHFVDHAMLDIDTARIRAGQVSDQLFEWRRIAEWIFLQQCDEFLRPGLESARSKFLRVFHCVSRVYDLPLHQFGDFALFFRGSAIPFLIDSRIPGMERR